MVTLIILLVSVSFSCCVFLMGMLGDLPKETAIKS